MDAHSHSSVEGQILRDSLGNPVLLTQAGSMLQCFGMLRIGTDGSIRTQLISEYPKQDSEVNRFLESIQSEYRKDMEQVLAISAADLLIMDSQTNRRSVRFMETNLGDLVTDALRTATEADVAVLHGSGFRSQISAGKVTYGNVLRVLPFPNDLCRMELTGQLLLDMLEYGVAHYPAEWKGFLQVSGMSYELHSYLPSAVETDSEGNFVAFSGEYRVRNVRINGAPLEKEATYTLGGTCYLLKECCSILPAAGTCHVQAEGLVSDSQALVNYLVGHLGGAVGEEYACPQGRIKCSCEFETVLYNKVWIYSI